MELAILHYVTAIFFSYFFICCQSLEKWGRLLTLRFQMISLAALHRLAELEVQMILSRWIYQNAWMTCRIRNTDKINKRFNMKSVIQLFCLLHATHVEPCYCNMCKMQFSIVFPEKIPSHYGCWLLNYVPSSLAQRTWHLWFSKRISNIDLWDQRTVFHFASVLFNGARSGPDRTCFWVIYMGFLLFLIEFLPEFVNTVTDCFTDNGFQKCS